MKEVRRRLAARSYRWGAAMVASFFRLWLFCHPHDTSRFLPYVSAQVFAETSAA